MNKWIFIGNYAFHRDFLKYADPIWIQREINKAIQDIHKHGIIYTWQRK